MSKDKGKKEKIDETIEEQHSEPALSEPAEEPERIELNDGQQKPAEELPTSIEQIKIKEPVVGYLIGNKVAVREDFQNAQQFFDRSSFGEIFGQQRGVKEQRIEFSLDEALYLMERKKLDIYD